MRRFNTMAACCHRNHISLKGLIVTGMVLMLSGLMACGGDGISIGIGASTTIISPEDGSIYYQDENNPATISLSGTARNDLDGVLTGGSLVWTSNLDGQIGTGTAVAFENPSAGTHIIRLTATGSRGTTATAAITITVVSSLAPIPAILSPVDGHTYQQQSPIFFMGNAFDAQEGYLKGSALMWRSDLEGYIGVGESFSRQLNQRGQHQLTLYATNRQGRTGLATIHITVGNLADIFDLYIIAPVDGRIFQRNQPVQLAGFARNEQDGPLTGDALQWSSDRDGMIGTGESLTFDAPSMGRHTITLTAIDSRGVAVSTQITIEVVGNNAPEARIMDPAAGQVYQVGDTIIFNGSAFDLEDGNLTGNSLVWISSRQGELGTGGFFMRDDLMPGEHLITLTAIDSDGATGTVSRTIAVNTP